MKDLKRKQVRAGGECEKIDEYIKWTDFEHCPLGSVNLKESRKLGEVMAPDDDDRQIRGYMETHMRSRTWPDKGETRVKEGCIDCAEPRY